MTAMTADYQRGYRAGLKVAKGDTTRDKDVRAVIAAMLSAQDISSEDYFAFYTDLAILASEIADVMLCVRNKK